MVDIRFVTYLYHKDAEMKRQKAYNKQLTNDTPQVHYGNSWIYSYYSLSSDGN